MSASKKETTMGAENKTILVVIGLLVIVVVLNIVATIESVVNQRKIHSLEASVLILQEAVVSLQLVTLGDQQISPAERIEQ